MGSEANRSLDRVQRFAIWKLRTHVIELQAASTSWSNGSLSDPWRPQARGAGRAPWKG